MLEAQLIGNLGMVPEMRYTPDGQTVTSFSVACDMGKDKPPTWVRVSCWQQLAELATEHLSKGSKVFCRGRVRVSDYTDRDGEKRYSIDVTADILRFLSPKSGGASPNGEADGTSAASETENGREPETAAAGADDDMPW